MKRPIKSKSAERQYQEASYIGAMRADPVAGQLEGVGLRWRGIGGAELNYRLSRDDARRLVFEVISVLYAPSLAGQMLLAIGGLEETGNR